MCVFSRGASSGLKRAKERKERKTVRFILTVELANMSAARVPVMRYSPERANDREHTLHLNGLSPECLRK